MKNGYKNAGVVVLFGALMLGAPGLRAQTEIEPEPLAPAVQAQSNADDALKLELRDVITSWASAWQSQLDDVYLLHYHPDFRPEGFKSIDDWKANRRGRLKDPANIRIDLREFSVVAARDSNRAIVRFWLLYSRPGYADQTRKEMELRKLGQIWLIASERNLEVIKLAPP